MPNAYYIGSVGFGYSEPYLAHHGIKGQKWGIRRFRNEDGSLTEAGKKRYSGLGSSRRIQKDLNRLDQKLVIARRKSTSKIKGKRKRARMDVDEIESLTKSILEWAENSDFKVSMKPVNRRAYSRAVGFLRQYVPTLHLKKYYSRMFAGEKGPINAVMTGTEYKVRHKIL